MMVESITNPVFQPLLVQTSFLANTILRSHLGNFSGLDFAQHIMEKHGFVSNADQPGQNYIFRTLPNWQDETGIVAPVTPNRDLLFQRQASTSIANPIAVLSGIRGDKTECVTGARQPAGKSPLSVTSYGGGEQAPSRTSSAISSAPRRGLPIQRKSMTTVADSEFLTSSVGGDTAAQATGGRRSTPEKSDASVTSHGSGGEQALSNRSSGNSTLASKDLLIQRKPLSNAANRVSAIPAVTIGTQNQVPGLAAPTVSSMKLSNNAASNIHRSSRNVIGLQTTAAPGSRLVSVKPVPAPALSPNATTATRAGIQIEKTMATGSGRRLAQPGSIERPIPVSTSEPAAFKTGSLWSKSPGNRVLQGPLSHPGNGPSRLSPATISVANRVPLAQRKPLVGHPNAATVDPAARLYPLPTASAAGKSTAADAWSWRPDLYSGQPRPSSSLTDNFESIVSRLERGAAGKIEKRPDLALISNQVAQSKTGNTELTLHTPGEDRGLSAEPVLELSQSQSRTQSEQSFATPGSAAEQKPDSTTTTSLSAEALADQVYRILESRLLIERERRGIS